MNDFRIKTIAGVLIYQGYSESFKNCVEDAFLNGYNLENADFRSANLENIRLDGVSFVGADFEGANLSFSRLKGCNFTRSNLTNCNFFNANLSGSVFRSAKIMSSNFSQASIKNADFRSHDRKHGFFGNCFAGAEMTSCVINDLEIKDCDFSGASLRHAIFQKNSVAHCDFSKVDFRGANLYKTMIHNSALNNAILRAVNLHRTEFSEVDLSDADLTFSTLAFVCGNMNVKTSGLQRVKLSHYLFKWLDNADNLTEFEKQLKEFISDYASTERFYEGKSFEQLLVDCADKSNQSRGTI